MLIGLTGPSGAGKSTVASLFLEAGYRVIDCDALVHALYRDKRYIEKIAQTFGSAYILHGDVDRKKLGALVFSQASALEKLNLAVSPFISEAVLEQVEAIRKAQVDAVLDAPLLFEYGLETLCDATLGVIADPELAVARLCARDSRPEQEIRARHAAQHENDFFREHCDAVLENNGDINRLKKEFAHLLRSLCHK